MTIARFECTEICSIYAGGGTGGTVEVKCKKNRGHKGKHRWFGNHFFSPQEQQFIEVLWENKIP